MKRSLIIFILSASVQSQAWSFDPAVCTDKLEQQGLGPIMMDAPMSRVYASEVMYSPVKVIGCVNSQTQEHRFYPADRMIQNCMALSQQDPAWHLSNGYTCVGTGIFED